MTSDDVEINVKARQALIAALGGQREARRGLERKASSWPTSFPAKSTTSWSARRTGSSATSRFFATKSPKGCTITNSPRRPFRRQGIWTFGPNSTRLPRPCGLPPMLPTRTPCAALNARNWPRTSSAEAEEDHILLKLNRGHWNFLAGDPKSASRLLTEICTGAKRRHRKFWARRVCCWAGPHAALGNAAEARKQPDGSRRPLREGRSPATCGTGPGIPDRRALNLRCLKPDMALPLDLSDGRNG